MPLHPRRPKKLLTPLSYSKYTACKNNTAWKLMVTSPCCIQMPLFFSGQLFETNLTKNTFIIVYNLLLKAHIISIQLAKES